jgi:ribose transport system substrate-binding protein
MHGKRGSLVLAAAAVLVAAALAGCSSSGANAATKSGSSSKGTLLMEIPLRTNPSNELMAGGFLTECRKLGYTCEAVGTVAVDIPGSNALASAALAKGGVKGFADYGFDPATYPFMTQVSQQYSVPITSWHVPIPQGTVQGLTAIANGDPTSYGKAAADAMGQQMGGSGTIAISELSYNTTENTVAKSFSGEIKSAYPNITVIAPQLEGADAPTAVTKAVAILQAHPGVTAAFSTTGGGCQTWTGAQSQANKKLTIMCMDYTQQNLDMINSGQVFAVVAQPLFAEGAKMADLLDAAINHTSVSYYNPLDTAIVTKDNVSTYTDYIKQANAAIAGS